MVQIIKRKQKVWPLCFHLRNSSWNEQNPFQFHQKEKCYLLSRAALPRHPHTLKGVGGRTGVTWVLSKHLEPWWAGSELVPNSKTGSRSLNSREKPSSGNLTRPGKSETYLAGEAEKNKMQYLGKKLVHALAALWTVFILQSNPMEKRTLLVVG